MKYKQKTKRYKMKNVLIGCQLLFSFLFAIALISNFFTVDDIANKSRKVITNKVVKEIDSKVNLAEEVLATKAAKTYLETYQIEAISEEIVEFRRNPHRYVEAVTLSSSETSLIPVEMRSDNPLKNRLMGRIFLWKTSIKEHFENTFGGLVKDIHIFLFTNMMGLAIAAAIGIKSTSLGKSATTVSLILTFTIVISALGYMDKNWFYTILLNNYAGYSYPLGVFVTTLWLCYEYYKDRDRFAD